MYDVHDWAEVHRLHHVEGLSKAAVAAKLSMSRTTVHRLLVLAEPPRYRREPAGSQVDGFVDAIAAMLDENPRVPGPYSQDSMWARHGDSACPSMASRSGL